MQGSQGGVVVLLSCVETSWTLWRCPTMTPPRHQALSPDQLHSSNAYRGYPSDRFDLGEGIEIERFGKWRAGEVSLPAATHHRISMHVQEDGNRAPSRWNIEGRRFSADREKAMVAVVPAGSPMSATWDDTASGTLNFLVTQDALTTILDQSETLSSGTELFPGLHGLDPVLLDSAVRLVAELEHQQLGDRLMRDSLKLQMMVHILRHYSNRAPAPVVARFRRARLLHASAVAVALEYMRDNLDQRIGLDDLASVAGVSRFHFARLFRQALGSTPMQELTRLRVDRAKQLIERDGAWKSLAAIASECGFADQSHLGRQFKSRLGATPGAFLRSL